MRLTRLTYSRVAEGMVPGAPVLRELDDGVAAFLGQHVDRLRQLSARNDTAAAHFREDALRASFADLAGGEDPRFLAAAAVLGARLVAAMDGRTKAGLLVCATLDDGAGGDRVAAVLKLEVVADNGAVLERLDTGEDRLSAVTDVLERPGELQKGCLHPDLRPGSDAVLGDKLNTHSIYFPNALGLTQERRPADAAGALVNAVAQASDDATAARVAAALAGTNAGTVEEVLAEVRLTVDGITDEQAAGVVAALANATRPVVVLDPVRPVKGEILAGAVRIIGPVSVARDARWKRVEGTDTWEVTVTVDTNPRRKFS